MSPELPPLTAYVETFAAEWRQTEDPVQKEIARRNLIAAVLVVADEVWWGRLAVDEGTVAAAAVVSCRQHSILWRARRRMVFGNMQSPPNDPLPGPSELLTSLATQDGRFRHDLSVFVP